ncbi:hypothetical protein B0H11DRAFT_2376172 [Mycena galericulata]|nr:hypothetical protein B0H11DRAFT_2391950 [Mycena galericulata]KAJ7433345.1 hypothetical protein B0H11DRAFT_2376172 [Mycena galericulata]
MTLSHTSHLFRTLVKTLFRIRLIRLVELFVGLENVEEFFAVLQHTESAISGSSLPLVLIPPIDDYIENWTPNNLNIYVPDGNCDGWDNFLRRIDLHPMADQPGVSQPFNRVTRSHVEYSSRLFRKTIMISESIDACVITPATAATTTLGMCIATCSSMYILYPDLISKRRTLEGCCVAIAVPSPQWGGVKAVDGIVRLCGAAFKVYVEWEYSVGEVTMPAYPTTRLSVYLLLTSR